MHQNCTVKIFYQFIPAKILNLYWILNIEPSHGYKKSINCGLGKFKWSFYLFYYSFLQSLKVQPIVRSFKMVSQKLSSTILFSVAKKPLLYKQVCEKSKVDYRPSRLGGFNQLRYVFNHFQEKYENTEKFLHSCSAIRRIKNNISHGPSRPAWNPVWSLPSH